MTSRDIGLRGKSVLVTGAGKGIGRAVAIAFGKEGCNVACISRTQADLEATVHEINAVGGKGMALPCDVTDYKQVAEAFQVIGNRWGILDVLMLNAGGNLDTRSVEESDPEVWLKIVNVNLIGAYYCAKQAIPLLRKSKDAKIIVTGSGMGHRGKAGVSAYACGKAGLWMLTRVLAQELRELKISVNELIPGPVETNQEASGLTNWRQRFEEMGEWVKTPHEVVPLALFLASQPPGGPTAQSYSLMCRDS